jgi:carbon-monoxide dehydrogenase large subunit
MKADPWVGRPVPRREDASLLVGDGTFIDNLAPPDALHLVMVRSPFAHARVRSVDRTAAEALPGVTAVVTAGDLDGGAAHLPVTVVEGAQVATDAAMPLLARDVVRFAGEPVAAVLADSRAVGEDAAELVAVDYEPLPVVTDPRLAPSSGVRLHPDVSGNVLLRWRRSGGAVDAGFDAADRVVTGHFAIPRLVACPIEPRGCVAAHDAEADMLTLWCSAQDPHRPLAHLSAVLGRPAERLRVVVPDVGGAFGSKGSLAPEHAVAAMLAVRWGRPVKWIEDRQENFLAAYQGRGLEADVWLAVDADGRFLALRARLVADLGAYLYPSTAIVPLTVATLATGAYDVPSADVEVLGVATNKVPTGPYRGAGRPEAAFLIERMTDLAAGELGMDPVEIRRRNLVPRERFPHTTPMGLTYDSGDYRGSLDRACELLGYDEWRGRQRAARDEGRLLGLGFAVFVERAGPQLWESAAAAIRPDGRVVIRTGSSAHGQGHETTFAQIAADVLEVDPSDVTVVHGDSAEVPAGIGTFGSRSVTIGGSAVMVVLEEVRARALAVAAGLLEASQEDVRWEGGRFVVAGSDRGIGLREVAEAASSGHEPADGMASPLRAEGRFTMAGPVFPFGAYAAVVEIDRATGSVLLPALVAVDDAGTIVNPLLAEGQVRGSILQGLAAALSEEAVHDEEGQLVTGSFMAYGIPSSADLAVKLRSEFRCTPSPLNPLGAKGLGESGTIGVPAAVANAVADALAPLGIRTVDPPFTPEKLWRLLHDARPSDRPAT